MQKRIVLIPFLILPYLMSFSQKESDLKTGNIKGKVKEITEREFDMRGKDTVNFISYSLAKNVIRYNKSGNEVLNLYYQYDGKIDQRFITKYNNKKRKETILLFDEKKLRIKTIFLYNNGDKLVEETDYIMDLHSIFIHNKFSYNYLDDGD